MADWTEILATASSATTLARARSAVGTGVEYRLGKGGFDPSRPLGPVADCSGFAAWALGIPRELPPGSGRWLQTTSYWQGGGPAGTGLFDAVAATDQRPGDLIVYPDQGGKQGHMGIVSAVDRALVTRVIHCACGNFRRHGDAILETDPSVFAGNGKTRVVRADFPALRAIAGLAEPTDDDAEAIDTPFPEAHLRHPLLSDDPTLARVATGTLILEPTDAPVAGAASLHRALNRLAGQDPALHVDLGPGEQRLDHFGPATGAALRRLQHHHGLSVSGELDAATLAVIDTALLGEDVAPTPAGSSARLVRVSFDGRDWHATIDDVSFAVGRRVSYGRRRGLANHYWRSVSPAYDAEAHARRHGHWAWMIEPSARCESHGCFNCLNTYDLARFTFGFYQFAAHTPDANLVVLLRRLLALPAARDYFPDLLLHAGRVSRQGPQGPEPLETRTSTTLLQDYLNPGETDVEEIEAIQAAKLIHWSGADDHQQVQVATAVDKLRTAMPGYARRYALDGRSDLLCLVIGDIRHQGRARSTEIIAALDTPSEDEALQRLLAIGDHAYPERIRTLGNEVRRLHDAGILGRRRYDAGRNDFR